MVEPNSPFPSIDNERPDMVLAHDKDEGTKLENYYSQFSEIQDRAIVCGMWGTAEFAEPISRIIFSMIESRIYEKILIKSQVIQDIEVSEAITDACIILALTDEDFSPVIHDQGSAVSLRLV